MKKLMVSAALLLTAFVFAGCSNDSGDEYESKFFNDYKAPELPAPLGKNEFAGKTLKYGKDSYEFKDENIVYYTHNGEKQREYKYSYDSEKKVLYFVMDKIYLQSVDTGEGKLYTVDDIYQLIKASSSKAYYDAMFSVLPKDSLISMFKEQGVTITGNESVDELEKLYFSYYLKLMNYYDENIDEMSINELCDAFAISNFQMMTKQFRSLIKYGYAFINDDKNIYLTDYVDETDNFGTIYDRELLNIFNRSLTGEDVKITITDKMIVLLKDVEEYSIIKYDDKTITGYYGEGKKKAVFDYELDLKADPPTLKIKYNDIEQDFKWLPPSKMYDVE